ncbi:Pentatricopeptide repeat-containing protein [Artemisia annua]|uniref:Pentatricopeptide repeat-containing protein n=1 Tax=Artemisia annua TaxID=35608 RepID=A0A2U1LPR2_ARTAN|nr:Pentatricopeptide repeat-containing protein [Artemisia annua]
MEGLKSSFLNTTPLNSKHPSVQKKKKLNKIVIISCSVSPDPWSLSNGNKPKPKSKNPKNPLSDDNARRIIKSKALYLSTLRRNQGSQAQTPRWIKRSPEQMIQYLEDDRNGHLYGRHVVAAIQRVRSLSGLPDGSYDMRQVMASFVTSLTFREMCTVLKEQKSWRQVRDFFEWMKLQMVYRPSVIVYTLVLRTYGQTGKIKLAEETFLEMLEAGCEPDEVACGTMLCAYAKWGRHKPMLSFYSAVQQRGIILSVAVYNFMLSSLHKKSLHENVIDIWRHMAASGVTPDPFTYTLVISSLVKNNLTDEAFRTFTEMKTRGYVPEEATYSLLISLTSKNNLTEESIRLYQDMRLQKLVPSNFTCASLLSLYYRSGNYSKALSLFSEMERYRIVPDEVIYGLLIRIYGKLGLYEDAMTTFEEIRKLGLLSDDKTYLAMAQVHLNERNYEKALDLMEHMRSKNVSFSRFAYIVLLRCYVMKEDVEAAQRTFQSLSETGFPDSSSCNDMLTLYMKLGLTDKATDFIIQIRKNKVKLDKVLLKTVMKVYCNEKMASDAEQLIRELSTNGLYDDDNFIKTILMVTRGEYTRFEGDSYYLDQTGAMAFELLLTLYMATQDANKMEKTLKLLLDAANGLKVASQLVNNFMREGLTPEAESLVGLLLKLNCKPEVSTISSMIYLYGKQNQLERANQMFKAVADTSSERNHLCNSMIDVYVKSAKVDDAYLFFKEETEKGHDVGAIAISMLVNALISCGKHREARNVINDCFSKNMELDTVAYNTFIKAMLDAGRLNFAASIYDRMLTNGVAPSIQTFNTMITVHGRRRDLDKAIDMFNTARIKGVALDEKAYTNMICYYGKAGRSEEASILFNQMQEEGIKPGKVSYNIMMNVYGTGGFYKEAAELFNSMKRDGFSPDSYTYLALVRAYASSLKLMEAEEVISLMQNEEVGISPSCAHYNLLLSAYAKRGLVEEFERVYELVITAGLTPDVGCYQTMLRVYMDYGFVEKGISLYESISSESVRSDRFIMSAAVHLYRLAGFALKAEDVLSCMNKMGIPFLKNLGIKSKIKVAD